MNCKNCGKHLNQGDSFCNNCGTKVESEIVNTVNNNPTRQDKSNNTLNIVLIIIGAIILTIIVGIVIIVITSLYMVGKVGSDIATNDGISDLLDDKVTVNVGEFELTLSEDYETQVDGNSIVIADEDATFISNIEFTEGSFILIKQDFAELKSALESEGLIVKSDARIETFGGREFINIDVEDENKNFMISYTKIDGDTMAVITSLNDDHTYDYSILNKIDSILDSAKKSSITDDNSKVTEKDVFSDVVGQ